MIESWPTDKYRTIVIDPPWPLGFIGKYSRHGARALMPYRTMTVDAIAELPVGELAQPGAHLWLWTTNRMLPVSFEIMRAWGFTYLNTVTWVKSSGIGAYFINTTQHCLFGYFGRCDFPLERYFKTHFHSDVKRGDHSRKPEKFYWLVKQISPAPRIDLFNRRELEGFDGWGDESPPRRQISLFDQEA